MLNLYTIATHANALSGQLGLPLYNAYKPVYQARPGMTLPVIVFDSKPRIVAARWGCATEAATMSLNSFPMDRVPGQPPFNRWIHTQRCLVPSNCFFARRTDKGMRPGDHDTFLVRILEKRLFLIGGLYSVQHFRTHEPVYSFLLLTTQSADVLKSLTEQMPVIMQPDEMRQWLTSEHLFDIMHIADRSGDHWFDYFPVSSSIIQPGVNNRSLLKPLGVSLQEQIEKAHKMKAVDVRQDRFDRRGGKW